MRKLVEFQILDINAEHYGLDFFELKVVIISDEEPACTIALE